MTFGKIKSLIETTILESYSNPDMFKKSIREFKQNILNNKNFSKLYSLYDQLNSPQGLNESEAKEFLNEGITLIQYLIPKVKLPKSLNESSKNDYKDIDILVYGSKTDISERIVSKKRIIEKLMEPKMVVNESVQIPISSMVKVANQTVKNYLETLDETSKKELLYVLSEDVEVLETKFQDLKESAVHKLNVLLESENELETKSKLAETINKIKEENFDQISYVKLKTLEQSL